MVFSFHVKQFKIKFFLTIILNKSMNNCKITDILFFFLYVKIFNKFNEYCGRCYMYEHCCITEASFAEIQEGNMHVTCVALIKVKPLASNSRFGPKERF